MTTKRFKCHVGVVGVHIGVGTDEHELTGDECRDLLNDYADENERLNQFKENVFDLIDKNIKETKELFEDGKIDLISHNGAMIILIGLKEELKGDGE